MKLFRDFGIRALLSVMSVVGFYLVLMFILTSRPIDSQTMAVIALASAPATSAISFYFGSKVHNESNK